MLKDVIDLTTNNFKGLNTNKNIFSLTKDQSPNMMNVQVDQDNSLIKRLGTITMNTVIIADSAAAGFSPSSGNTLPTSLQAFWNMNEASGTRYDSFGGNLLSAGNNPINASGIKNAAALFVASSSQYIYHADTSTLSTGNINFAMSTWFYLNSTSTTLEQTLIGKRDFSGPFGGIDTSVVLLLHCDGANGSQVFTDSCLAPHIMTASGNVQNTTNQMKFGPASAAFDGNGDYIQTPNNGLDWNFGTGDFTAELQLYFNPTGGTPSGLIGTGFANGFLLLFNDPSPQIIAYITNTSHTFNWVPTINTWNHVALVRSSNVLKCYVNGSSLGSFANAGNITGNTGNLFIGWDAQADSTFQMGSGYMDEVRISKSARWATDFTAPTTAYSAGTEYEYWLYVNTDQIVTFRVSSSGTGHDGTIRATSFGALTTATWYNAVAYHDSANSLLAVGVNLSMTSASYTSGVRGGAAPFNIGAINNGGTYFLDARLDETGFWKKTLTTQERSDLYNAGSSNTYQIGFNNYPWASFDFGASSIRWLTVAAGTGIYASSNLGITWVNIATDRTANYQYFERSKNVLVSGSDSYNNPLFWAGSAGTFMSLLNVSAPLVKYWVNHQGFLIGLNSSTRKRGFFYEDENSQLTGGFNGTLTPGGNFDIQSSDDDEITNGFVLKRRLYVSTRYLINEIDYIGGNPDWSYRKIKDFGFVPRTVQIMDIEGIGEVAVGLDWGNRIRIFDGANSKIISLNAEDNNELCDFALDKISNSGSGRVVSFAQVGKDDLLYRLCLSIGADSMQTTHFLNYSGRTQAFWPDDNRPFNTMTTAESNNTQYVMAFDRSGRCHMLDSGNKDAGITPIQDVYDFAYLYDKSPSQSQKNHTLDLYFENNNAGRIYFKESINFDNQFKDKENFVISGTGSKFIFTKGIDVPSETNSYQPRITSSGGTSDPWHLYRYDFFTKSEGIGRTE